MIILEALSLATSVIAITGVVVTIGVYKSKIDRHERLLNFIEEEFIRNMIKRGMVQHQSFPTITNPNILGTELRQSLDSVRDRNNLAPSTSHTIKMDAIAKAVPPGLVSNCATDLGITISEAMGLCIAYLNTKTDGTP